MVNLKLLIDYLLIYILFACILAGTLTLVITINEQTIWHYILYIISAIMLSYFVYTIVYLAPKMKENIVKTLKKHKFTNKILSDYGYRTIIFSIFSFILNLSYIVFVGVIGVLSGSAWYISMTIYYLIFSLMKGNVFYSKYKYNTELKKARAYRFAGIMFIILPIALSAIVLLMYKSNMYFEYAGLMIYVVATFTFYKMSLSIYNIFKAKKHDNLYIQTIRNINLASACVSMLVLQVAMFQSFSPESNAGLANAFTGAGISIVILILGIFMIIRANKEIKDLKQKEIING